MAIPLQQATVSHVLTETGRFGGLDSRYRVSAAAFKAAIRFQSFSFQCNQQWEPVRLCRQFSEGRRQAHVLFVYHSN